MLVSENRIADTAEWDRVLEIGNTLMLCRMGTTTHRMINDVMHFYVQYGIDVCGAAGKGS